MIRRKKISQPMVFDALDPILMKIKGTAATQLRNQPIIVTQKSRDILS